MKVMGNFIGINKKTKIVIVLMLMSACAFLVTTILGAFFIAAISKALLIVLFLLFYLLHRKKGDLFFGVFVFGLFLSEFLNYKHIIFKESLNLKFLNFIYIIPYASLFNHLALDTKLKVLFKKYFMQSVLILIIAFLGYKTLNNLLDFHENAFKDFDSIVDFSFSTFIILIFVFSSFNYLLKREQRSLMLFFGSLCIVFAEFFIIFSYYQSYFEVFNFIYTLFFVTGFYFFSKYILLEKRASKLVV